MAYCNFASVFGSMAPRVKHKLIDAQTMRSLKSRDLTSREDNAAPYQTGFHALEFISCVIYIVSSKDMKHMYVIRRTDDEE